MAYRDEREAMQARIEQLESELREVRAAYAGPSEATERQPANPWFGAPLRLVFEREVPGELPETSLEELVAVVRRGTDQLGRTDRLGGTLAWSVGPTRDGAQRAPEFTCEVRDGRIRLRLTENERGVAGGLFGGIVGGVGGGGLGVWIPLAATQLIHPALGVALMLLWIAIVWLIVRMGFSALIRRREAHLKAIFDQLVAAAERGAKAVRVETPRRIEDLGRAEAERQRSMLEEAEHEQCTLEEQAAEGLHGPRGRT